MKNMYSGVQCTVCKVNVCAFTVGGFEGTDYRVKGHKFCVLGDTLSDPLHWSADTHADVQVKPAQHCEISTKTVCMFCLLQYMVFQKNTLVPP